MKSLVKKYLVSGLMGLAIIGLAISHYQIQSKFEGSSNKVLSFEEGVLQENNTGNVVKGPQTESLSANTGEYDLGAIPHLYCDAQAEYDDLPSSQTYNDDFAYPTHFMGSGSHFQDLNGDNLVDYVWNYVNLSGSNPETESNYKSCVYLNNGNGWIKASICKARTRVNNVTGQVLEAEYKGDCAAEQLN